MTGADNLAALRHIAALKVGDGVTVAPHDRHGPGYLMFMAREGVHDVGGETGIYVRSWGGRAAFVALTHVKIPEPS